MTHYSPELQALRNEALQLAVKRNSPDIIADAEKFFQFLTGEATPTKENLAKSISNIIREEVKRGTIPPNWAAA